MCVVLCGCESWSFIPSEEGTGVLGRVGTNWCGDSWPYNR